MMNNVKTCWGFLAVAISLYFVGVGIAAQDESLVLYLPLDENQGDTALDQSQYHNDATLNGKPKWVDGRFNSALELGTNNFLTVADSDSLDITDALTINCWVNVAGGGTQSAVEKGASWAAGEYNLLPVYNGGVLLQMFDLPEGCDDEAIGGIVSDQQWHFIAGTWDGKVIRIYIDGDLSKELACKGALTPNTGSLYIGSRGGGERWMNGSIDEIKIYNRALSEEELKVDMEDPGASLAVSLTGKLTTLWAQLKQ